MEPLAGTADLADQRCIHVELSGYGTAAIKVQGILAAELVLLTQRWLAGCPLLLKITTAGESTSLQMQQHQTHKKIEMCINI